MPNTYNAIRQYVHSGQTIANMIDSVQTLEELQNLISTNLTLKGTIIDLSSRTDDKDKLYSIVSDIGHKWAEFTDLGDDIQILNFTHFMRDLGTSTRRAAYLDEAAMRFIEELAEEKNQARGIKIIELFSDQGFPENITLPTIGYSVNDQGYIRHGKSLISKGPLFITKRINFPEVKRTIYQCTFRKATGEWEQINIPKEHIGDTKKLATYMANDLPIGPDTVKNTAKYLSDFIEVNGNDIPTVLGISHCGWNVENTAFAFGPKIITANGPSTEEIELSVDPSLERNFKAVNSQGVLAEWLEHVFWIALENKKNGYFLIGLLTVLSSPLLQLLEKQNGWFLHFFGESSTGKTTLAKVLSSAVGKPADILKSWNMTKVWLERYNVMMNSITVFLDEAHLAKEKDISGIIYESAGGIGRGRGSTGAGMISENSEWKNNVVSTGEIDIKDSSPKNGMDVRVISISSHSFFVYGAETVDKVNQNCRKYYGTLMPAYLEKLMQRDYTELETIKDRYHASFKELGQGQALVSNLGLVNRVSENFAIMALALDILAETIDTNLDDLNDLLVDRFEAAIAGLSPDGMDFSERVVQYTYSWIMSNSGKFLNEARDDQREPTTGWLGKLMDNQTIAVFKEPLEAYLKRNEYDLKTFLSSAEKEGVLVQQSGRDISKVRFLGKQARMIVLRFKDVPDP